MSRSRSARLDTHTARRSSRSGAGTLRLPGIGFRSVRYCQNELVVTSEKRKPRLTTTRTSTTPSTMTAARASNKIAHEEEQTALTNDAHQSETQELISGLPHDVVITHILKSEFFRDPIDLPQIRAVSSGMRDAVAGMGRRKLEDQNVERAALRGFLSTLKHKLKTGHLTRKNDRHVCERAARSGHLETLKWERKRLPV